MYFANVLRYNGCLDGGRRRMRIVDEIEKKEKNSLDNERKLF